MTRPNLWQGTKRGGAAFAMGLVGAVVLGSPSLLAAVIGFWPYASGFGGMLTGFMAGAVYGWRIPVRDAIIVFAVTYGVLLSAIGQGAYARHDGYWTMVVALVISPGPAILTAVVLPTLVPPRWRYNLAFTLSILFLLGTVAMVFWIGLFGSVS